MPDVVTSAADSSRPPGPALAAVLAVLMATGWAANHFAAVLPVLQQREGLSTAVLDAVFGVYAVGLLPGLFLGGALSDRVGRAAVVLPGASTALLGSLLLASWHDAPGLFVGRLVVGLGAGMTFGAGTAWAADLRGAAGTVLAGVFLTSGFGVGPFVSGLVAQWAPGPETVPFLVSATLSAGAVAAALVVAGPSGRARERVARFGPPLAGRSVGAAMSWALPMALWVFASVTVVIITLAGRLPDGVEGPILIGTAALVSLGSGIVVQNLARLRHWGPRTGVVGALLSALGFLLLTVGGGEVSLPLAAAISVVMGTAYALCLREGLLDLEALAPLEVRGLVTGVYYVVTYLGFGLPLLLTVVEPRVGMAVPTLVLAAAAALTAGWRQVRLRRTHHRSPVLS